MITVQRIKDTEKPTISYKTVNFNLRTGEIMTASRERKISDDAMNAIKKQHKIILTASILDGVVLLCVPDCWTMDIIKNYTDAFISGLKLKNIDGEENDDVHYFLKQFDLEMIVF